MSCDLEHLNVGEGDIARAAQQIDVLPGTQEVTSCTGVSQRQRNRDLPGRRCMCGLMRSGAAAGGVKRRHGREDETDERCELARTPVQTSQL